MSAVSEHALIEHAEALLRLGQLYAAIGASDDFPAVAATWPHPGEHACSPDDIALSVERLHEQVRQAAARRLEPLRIPTEKDG